MLRRNVLDAEAPVVTANRLAVEITEVAQRREDELKTAFKRAGVDALSLSTEEDLVRAIVRFAKQRRQYRK